MRRTLKNLEKEEDAFVEAYNLGMRHGGSMRQHLNNIRKYGLYEGADFDDFTAYCRSDRLTSRVKSLSQTHLYRIAANGEVEAIVEEHSHVREWSERALEALSKLRTDETDETGRRAMDASKIRRVAKAAMKKADKENVPVTSTMIKEIAEKFYGPKPPKPIEDQLQAEIKRCGKWAISLQQLDQQVFLDADRESPGVVKRLAKAYSELASLLRKAGVK